MKITKCSSILLVPTIIAAIATALILAHFLSANNFQIHGEKLENGIQVEYGTITSALSVHGGDYIIWLNSRTYEFEWGMGYNENRPRNGENIAIAYEWQLLTHWAEFSDIPDQNWRYWTPVIHDWRILR